MALNRGLEGWLCSERWRREGGHPRQKQYYKERQDGDGQESLSILFSRGFNGYRVSEGSTLEESRRQTEELELYLVGSREP